MCSFGVCFDVANLLLSDERLRGTSTFYCYKSQYSVSPTLGPDSKVQNRKAQKECDRVHVCGMDSFKIV